VEELCASADGVVRAASGEAVASGDEDVVAGLFVWL
jgi:hypothetical protein